MRDRCSYHEPHTRNKSADVGARQTHRTARRDFSSKAQVRTRPRWLCAALPCGAIVGGIIGTAYAAKKIPPIAGPMYLTAYASVVTGQSKNAVKPLSYLAVADPSIADVQNALALALFTTDPSKHAIAHAHAKKAVGMAPDVPQFTYTMVLTDTKQWKISGDGHRQADPRGREGPARSFEEAQEGQEQREEARQAPGKDRGIRWRPELPLCPAQIPEADQEPQARLHAAQQGGLRARPEGDRAEGSYPEGPPQGRDRRGQETHRKGRGA